MNIPEDITLGQIEHVLPCRFCIYKVIEDQPDEAIWIDLEKDVVLTDELRNMYVVMMGTESDPNDPKSSHLYVALVK